MAESERAKVPKIIKTLIALHCLLLFYTFSGILSKTASGCSVLSFEFVLLYGGMLFVLFVYAIGWQQIIKRISLTLAFANKAVTVVWGMLWGVLFFHEGLNAGMVFGAVLVVSGIVLYSLSDYSCQYAIGSSEELMSSSCAAGKASSSVRSIRAEDDTDV